jgi:DNA adenine methylase
MSMNEQRKQHETENERAVRPAGGDSAPARPVPAPPSRPALRYHGGKWRLAPWIISHFPAHRCYVEPFGGAASVLLRKKPAYSEVYNDLDGEVVNFFRVLRSRPGSEELRRQLDLTPFSREAFKRAWEPATGDVERARRLVVRSMMSFSTIGATQKTRAASRTGFRAGAHRRGKIPAHSWASYPAAIEKLHERVRGVVIEARAATEVIQQQDRQHTLFYVDPPYLPSTRGSSAGAAYEHELTEADHHELLALLDRVEGMVVLSGYPSDLYEGLCEENGWQRIDKEAYAGITGGASHRTECLYLNPAAQAQQPQQSLFS